MQIPRSTRFFNSLKVVFAFASIVMLSAFRHTDIEGYTDPNYTGYTFRTVVVQFPNGSLTFKKHVVKQLQKRFKKQNIRMFQHDELFTPTREWSEAAMREIYKRNGIDAGLIITMGATGSETTPGTVLYNGSTIGNTTTGYATQVTFRSDQTSFEIALVDVDSKDTVWIGDLDTRGAGLLFVGAKSTAKGLVKGLLKEWKKVGHLAGK